MKIKLNILLCELVLILNLTHGKYQIEKEKRGKFYIINLIYTKTFLMQIFSIYVCVFNCNDKLGGLLLLTRCTTTQNNKLLIRNFKILNSILS